MLLLPVARVLHARPSDGWRWGAALNARKLQARPFVVVKFVPLLLAFWVKATENDKSAKKPLKVISIVCKDCEGNGAIVCTQCEGGGVNSVDHFNGRFKAGALCWLCRISLID
ncbi:hypothetical protein U9M48_034791 [Paspalum notatum var. saurae]|uniref:BSD2 cysteine rich domain-containing protein n=1 Tax=Paspalum notatum var. saurae TaxID=547442 RepID=A0AAQ3U9U6_PASNO